MRTVKIPIFTASLTFLLFLTGCKEFFADIEKDFSYWTSMVRIVDTVLGTVQIDNGGYPCIPAPASGSAGKDIILNLHNPRGYTFIMPNASGAPSDIIAFESGVTGSSGSGSPVYGTDYTMMQISPAEIKLSFTGNFLRYSQNGRQNLSPTISLYNTDGRKFDSYTFKLRCNNVPLIVPNDSDIKIGKTTGSAPCYVFCFKHRFATEIWQQDVNALCFKVDGTEYVRTFSVSSAGAVTPDPASTTGVYALVNRTGVVSLLSTDMPSGAGSPDTLPSISDSDIICLKTDVPVVSGGGVKKSFTLWLRDEKGLVSHTREKSTYVLKLSAPQIFAHSDIYSVPDSGIYTKSGTMDFVGNNDVNGGLSIADGSTEARAIPVYSAYGTDVKLIVKKDRLQNYPEGAVIKGRVSRVSGTTANPSFNEGIGGTSGTPAQISLPAPGETVYKSETWAEGAVFDTSDVRTLYYRVVKAVSSDTDPTVPVWRILKKAVEEKTAPDGTVIIDGEIKATSASGNSGEIVINKNLTIEGKTGKDTDILNADKDSFGTAPFRIFTVERGKKLTLKNLTLKNGKNDETDPGGSPNPNGKGGAVYSKGELEIRNVLITECEAKHEGGGIYCNMEGTGNTDGRKFFMENTDVTDCKVLSPGNGTGGGVLISGSNCLMNVKMTNVKIKKNKADKWGAGLHLSVSHGAKTTAGSVVLTNVTLEENELTDTAYHQAAGGGGMAFSSYNNTNAITLNECTITKNKTKSNGGGIKVHEATLILQNCTVKENEAAKGGGVYINESNLEMQKGVLTGNTATGEGGGVYLKDGTFKMSGSATVTPASEANKNDIYLAGGKKISLKGSLNPAGGIAGRITPEAYTAGTQVLDGDITAGTVQNNTKFTVTPQDLGSGNSAQWFINDEGKLKQISAVIKGSDLNAWKKLKEAVQNAQNGDAIIIDGEIKATNAADNSGEIVINKNLTIEGKNPNRTDTLNANSHHTGTTPADAPATQHRIFKVTGGTLTLKNITLIKGYAGKYDALELLASSGAGILLESGSVSLTQVDILNCGAVGTGGNKGKGGGIYIKTGTLTVSGSTLSSNRGSDGGGGVYIAGGTVTLEDTEIKDNTSSQQHGGGGVYVESGSMRIAGTSRITPSTGMDENKKGKNEVYLKNGVKITFNDNLTGTAPIARITPEAYPTGSTEVQVLDGSTVSSEYTKFTVTPEDVDIGSTRNWSITSEGKLKLTGAVIDGSGFSAWKKLKKAVQNAQDENTITIVGEIKATSDSGNSGEIVIDKKLTIKKADGASSAVLNANKLEGGKPAHRIFNVKANAHFTLEGLTLIGGQTPAGDPHPYGGAILMAEANITSTIKNCVIGQTGNSNIASQQGGGIYLNIAGGSLTVKDTQINSCTADGGGGIYLQSGNLIFEGVRMSGNTAVNGKGRAVWVEDGSFKIKDSSTTQTYLDPTTTSSKNPDDVYLAAGKTITVNGTLAGIPAGAFTSPQAARITPQAYTEGTQVVEAENSVVIGDVTNKFSVTPNGSTQWYVSTTGSLTTTQP